MWEPRRRPLKIGIHAELVAAGVEPNLINAALRLYCASYGYRRAMLTGAARLGLDGEPAGVVTLEEAASAEELQKRKVKWLAHKEVMRQRAEEKERERQEAEAAVARPKRIGLADLKQPRGRGGRTSMTIKFRSKYSDVDAFYARADLLRPMFGMWDALDPVAHAILDIVEAQRELADAIEDDADYDLGGKAAIKAAVEKRDAAGERLEEALGDRDEWPNPRLGL